MKFLGLRLCDHDSNVSFCDGNKVRYYKSERDLQVKHHGFNSLTDWIYILDRWNITPLDIDAICIVLDDDQLKKETKEEIKEELKISQFEELGFKCKIYRIDHHLAHALSCWTSGQDFDMDIVFDGFGNNAISHSIYKNLLRKEFYNLDQCPSIGELMGLFGKILGLSGHRQDHAGKIMALKGHSKLKSDTRKKYLDLFSKYNIFEMNKIWDVDNLFQLKKDSHKINLISIAHEISEELFADYFENKAEGRISYSGGIAQNTIINSKIKEKHQDLYIPPHCTDEGLSLGCIEFLRREYNQEKFDTTGFPFWQSDEAPETRPSKNTIKQTAEHLANGKIVGWYQGNGEVGSRALGNRSILMNPTIKNGKDILNQQVKHREWFRPFGASILEEETRNYFDWEESSPYMLYVMNILDKEGFPAITHVDGTCRIQTVSQELEDYYCLIEEFKKITGIPMLLNTSLNVNGKPISGHINDLNSINVDIKVVGDSVWESGQNH